MSCPSAFPRSCFEDSGAGAWATFVAFEQITRLTSVKTGKRPLRMDGNNGRIRRHAAEYVTRAEGRFGSSLAQMEVLGEVGGVGY